MKPARGLAAAEHWLAAALIRGVSVSLAGAFAFLVIAFAALRYAEPILDGDLFWHMAYARQMIERGTLVPDATLYSWTPASNAIVYCAWAAELALYGLWSLTGLVGVFAVRYAIVAVVLALLWLFARQQHLGAAPVTALALVMLVDLIWAGSLPKPEMFSLLFLACTVFLYAHARGRSLEGPPPLLNIYAVPAIVVLWVNVHGGFILLAPFLAATAAGEIVLFATGARAKLPRPVLLHLLAAWTLCAPATVLTPYGIEYPVGLVREYVLGLVPRPDVRWNAAYLSIFHPLADTARFLGWLIGMATLTAVLGWLAWRRAGAMVFAWLPLGLAAIAYVPFYVGFIRSTQCLPLVAAFLAVALGGMANRPTRPDAADQQRRLVGNIALAVAATLAAVGIAQTWLKPPRHGWLGFGIGYVNPVHEAEFLARQPLGPNLYNIFDSGGYLLWRLDPKYKVMTDSRSFPYLSWFEDQFAFTTGGMFEPFLKKYPADVAIIDLAKQDLWPRFFKTQDWRLVFYGPTAAVFVKADRLTLLTQAQADSDPNRFAALRSADAAVDVFQFATFLGDYRAADVVLRGLETTLRWQTPSAQLQRARAYRDAVQAIRRGEFAAALDLFERAVFNRPVSDRDRVVLTLLVALVRAPEQVDAVKQAQIRESLLRIVPSGFPWP